MDPNALIAEVISTGYPTIDQRAAYTGWIARGGFRVRVELHPATDLWARGARFGHVVRIRRSTLLVELDSGRLLGVHPSHLLGVVT